MEQEIVVYGRTRLGRDKKSVQDAEWIHQIVPRGNKPCANERDVKKMARACRQNGREPDRTRGSCERQSLSHSVWAHWRTNLQCEPTNRRVRTWAFIFCSTLGNKASAQRLQSECPAIATTGIFPVDARTALEMTLCTEHRYRYR